MFNTAKKLAVATALILATASTGAVAADAYVSPNTPLWRKAKFPPSKPLISHPKK